MRRPDPSAVGLSMTIGAPASALTDAIDIPAGQFLDVALLVGGSGAPAAVATRG